MRQGIPMTIASERMEDFSPGLDKDRLALLQGTADLEMAQVLHCSRSRHAGGTGAPARQRRHRPAREVKHAVT